MPVALRSIAHGSCPRSISLAVQPSNRSTSASGGRRPCSMCHVSLCSTTHAPRLLKCFTPSQGCTRTSAGANGSVVVLLERLAEAGDGGPPGNVADESARVVAPGVIPVDAGGGSKGRLAASPLTWPRAGERRAATGERGAVLHQRADCGESYTRHSGGGGGHRTACAELRYGALQTNVAGIIVGAGFGPSPFHLGTQLSSGVTCCLHRYTSKFLDRTSPCAVPCLYEALL